jgi:hypothetical protein
MSLDLTLKAAAIGLLVLSMFQFFFDSAVPLVPVVVANIIFVLSIFSRSQPQRVAVIAAALAVLIPMGAIRSYVKGDATLTIAMLNLLIFAYVAYICLQTLRGRAPAISASERE